MCRSRTITFTGQNLKPKTQVYVFFNKTDVNAHVTPASSTYSTVSSPVAGSPLVTSATGKVEGTFLIPDPKVSGNPRFETGDVLFTLTSSSTNGPIASSQSGGTSAAEVYHASGMLHTQQETIIATRNATVVRTRHRQNTSSTSTQAGPITNLSLIHI